MNSLDQKESNAESSTADDDGSVPNGPINDVPIQEAPIPEQTGEDLSIPEQPSEDAQFRNERILDDPIEEDTASTQETLAVIKDSTVSLQDAIEAIQDVNTPVEDSTASIQDAEVSIPDTNAPIQNVVITDAGEPATEPQPENDQPVIAASAEPVDLPTLAEVRRLKSEFASESRVVENLIAKAKASKEDKSLLLQTIDEQILRDANANASNREDSGPTLFIEAVPLLDEEDIGETKFEKPPKENKEPIRQNCMYEKDLEYYSGPAPEQTFYNFYETLGKGQTREPSTEGTNDNLNQNNTVWAWKELRRKERLVERKVNRTNNAAIAAAAAAAADDDDDDQDVIWQVSSRRPNEKAQGGGKMIAPGVEPMEKKDQKDAVKDNDDNETARSEKIKDKRMSKEELASFTERFRKRINGIRAALSSVIRERPTEKEENKYESSLETGAEFDADTNAEGAN